MKFWKKVGWLALGLTPFVVVFIWQTAASMIGMIVYSVIAGVQAGQTGTEIVVEELLEGFMSGTSYALLMLVVYIGYLVMFGLWYWLMFCRKKQTGSWKQVLKPQRIGGILVSGVALQILITMVLSIIYELFPKAMEAYAEVMEALGNDSVFMIICVCILAPIGEELIFRGLTQKMMTKAVPWQVAILLQAILFGVYHMNLIQGIYAMLLGILFGYIAYRYGSVVPGILLHVAVNSSSYAVGVLFPESLQEQPVIMGLFALAGLIVTIGTSILYLKGVKPQMLIVTADKTDAQSIQTN